MRTDGGAKVSFLFFIDIMMCISGVMLFVIMLLVLDLSNGTGLTAGAEKEAKDAIPALHKQIDELQPKLEALRQNANAPTAAPAPVPALNEKEAARQADLAAAQLKEKQRALEEMEKQISDLQAEKDKLPGNFRVVTYKFSDDDNQRALVTIECSEDKYAVAIPGLAPRVFKDEKLEDRLANVLQLLSTQDREKIAIVIAMKPSEFKNARVFAGALRKAGYQTGLEPLDEDRTTLKP